MIFNLVFKLIITIFFFFVDCSKSAVLKEQNDWNLNIIHTNDMHSRFEEISSSITECTHKLKEAGKCYGGFARLATLIRQTRNSSVPSIFLNAGDTYQGTLWYTVYKWEIVAKLMNILKPDVVAFGNHEFDDGPRGLVPFLKNVMFPTVACNLDFSNEPEMEVDINKSVILNVAGRKIGVIGYLTPDTKHIAKANNIMFYDEVESIRKEVKKLQAKGVNILIALGHSGFNIDKKIAAEVDDLDLVIGGHTNTFLYNGKTPSSEKSKGSYPTVVTQKSGRKVYVAQAGAYTKYLGNLTITFNAKGEIKAIDGNPILLDRTINQAPDVLVELDKLRGAVDTLNNVVVGHSKVLLYYSNECRTKECNLGNLIADAMIETNMEQYTGNEGWTDSAIAIVGSGTMKTSIDKSFQENITMGDLIRAAPHDNSIVKIEISGEQLLQVLEHGVADLKAGAKKSDPSGQFLHFSGLKVSYDLSKPNGSRVVPNSVLVRCTTCKIPTIEKLGKNKIYRVLTTDFIQYGGDGYMMLKETTPILLGISVIDAMAKYIQRRGTVYPSIDGRIHFIDYYKNSKEIDFVDDLDVEISLEFGIDN